MAKQTGAGVPATTEINSVNGVALATIEQLNGYVFADANALDVIRENLGGQQMTQADFTRIKFPSGGTTSWEVPSITGDSESVKTIDGIVLMYRNMRVYWEKEYTGASVPPDCSSQDLLMGRGTPGGICATCPYAQWESDPKGNGGQACKQIGALFIMKPGEILPSIVPVPATSVKIVKKFMLGLASKKMKHTDAILSFGLEQDKNKKGIAYSKIKPKFVAALPEAAKTQIGEFVKQFRESMDAVKFTKEDVGNAE